MDAIYAVIRKMCESQGYFIVTGRVRDAGTSQTKNIYCTLEDDNGKQLQCVLFREVNRDGWTHFNKGDTVTLAGRLEVYSRRGWLQLKIMKVVAIERESITVNTEREAEAA